MLYKELFFWLLLVVLAAAVTRRVISGFEARGSRQPLLFGSRQQHGKEGGCRKRLNRVWLHISTPPGSLSYIKHPISAILHLASCDHMHQMCNKTSLCNLFTTQQVGRNTCFKSDPGPVSSLSRELTGLWPEYLGGILHLTSSGGWVQCSATKANGNLLPRRKGQRGLRLDCSWDYLRTSLGNR